MRRCRASGRRDVPTVLIVEDDADIVRLLAHYLEKEGCQVRVARTGPEGLEAAREQPADLVILDLMLPGLNGLEICRRLRAVPSTAAVPILVLTAKSEETDKVVSLEVGADDYVTKPFSPRELVARVKALGRRSGMIPEPRCRVFRYRNVTLDASRHEVSVSGSPVPLTAKEFRLLEYLIATRGRLASRDTLLSSVWGYEASVTTRTIDVHIHRLREKIPMLASAILTVKSFGYKLRDSQSDGEE